MQVFTEFIKSDLTDDQILPVLRQLLPVLLSILGAPEVSPHVTTHTVPLKVHIAARTVDTCTDSVRLSSMRHGPLHGQRPAPPGGQGSNIEHPSRVARCI